ncbi:MAG: HEPN domain-containing protein [bacterium]|nr:HEPN domain-containing protein [bacterium]
MTNPDLGRDYVQRARKRLRALDVLLGEEAFADVVRESQEVVELALKGLLRTFGVAVPFVHDVSDVLRGSEDVTPSDFYGRAEAEAAHGMAHEVVAGVLPHAG